MSGPRRSASPLTRGGTWFPGTPKVRSAPPQVGVAVVVPVASGEAWESKPCVVDGQSRAAIPPEALKALNVKAGDLVAFTVEKGEVRLHRVRYRIEK